MTPEQILELLLEGLSPVITDRMPVAFTCNCSKERIEKVLVSLGREELEALVADGQPIEVNCHFCGKSYTFSLEELRELLK